jgi:hypothetical protein
VLSFTKVHAVSIGEASVWRVKVISSPGATVKAWTMSLLPAYPSSFPLGSEVQMLSS